MINLYTFNKEKINNIGNWCSDGVFRQISGFGDMRRNNVHIYKSLDAIPDDLKTKENMDKFMDLLNSLYPDQYKVSIVDNFGSNKISIKKTLVEENVTYKNYLSKNSNKNTNLNKGFCFEVKGVLNPFAEKGLFINKSLCGIGESNDIGPFYSINCNPDTLVDIYSYDLCSDNDTKSFFKNQITFKTEYLTISKNFNTHSCWQLLNSIIRMLDNPSEQGILRTYFNLLDKYKDENKFTLFGLACTFPDNNEKTVSVYGGSFMDKSTSTYGHLKLGVYNTDHKFIRKCNFSGNNIIPVFVDKINIAEKYRDASNEYKGRFIFDKSKERSDYKSDKVCTITSTGTYNNIYNKNYSGVLSEFNIKDIIVYNSLSYSKSPKDVYKTIDFFYVYIKENLNGIDQSKCDCYKCISEEREKGFFKDKVYYKNPFVDDVFINEFNIVELVDIKKFKKIK